MKEKKTAVQNCHSVNPTVSIGPLLIGPRKILALLMASTHLQQQFSQVAVSVCPSMYVCVCACSADECGTKKNICTSAYHHNVTLLMTTQDVGTTV